MSGNEGARGFLRSRTFCAGRESGSAALKWKLAFFRGEPTGSGRRRIAHWRDDTDRLFGHAVTVAHGPVMYNQVSRLVGACYGIHNQVAYVQH
jgi:hypothetical protein